MQYERHDNWFCGPSDEEDERYSFKARPERVVIISSPFARATVAEIFDNIPVPTRLVAFNQLLQGVCTLHEADFRHRDLKLSNWGVVQLSPPEINTVILDYGQTVCATSCEPKVGSIGTIPYLAPEMELETYGPGVDIWACGIIGRQLFITDGKFGWQNVVHERGEFITAMTILNEEAANTVANLILQMLNWDPSQRISAKDALQHPCFSSLPGNGALPPQSGQKRSWQSIFSSSLVLEI